MRGSGGMASQMSELLQEAEEVEAEPQRKKKSHCRREDQPGSGYRGLEPREAIAAGGCLSPAEA